MKYSIYDFMNLAILLVSNNANKCNINDNNLCYLLISFIINDKLKINDSFMKIKLKLNA